MVFIIIINPSPPIILIIMYLYFVFHLKWKEKFKNTEGKKLIRKCVGGVTVRMIFDLSVHPVSVAWLSQSALVAGAQGGLTEPGYSLQSLYYTVFLYQQSAAS